MKSVLLTGATGFIGSHLAETLLARDIPTQLWVRRTNRTVDRYKARGALCHVGHPQDKAVLRRALRGVDTVIHCAGATDALTFNDYQRANVNLTLRLLRLLEPHHRFVYISSQAAAGPSIPGRPIDEQTPPSPLTHYGLSKQLAENHVRSWGAANRNNYVILRPCTVYGPRERNLYRCFQAIQKGWFVNPGRYRMPISMIYINDLISAVMAAAKYSIGGETYFIANDCGCSWETIGRCIGKALGLETVRILKIPYVLVSTLAIFSEGLARLRQRPTLFDRQRALELGQAAWECSNRKLRRELGWQPAFTLPAGLRATADWYRQHGWL